MFLKEYEGKELFEQYGIPVPAGVVFSNSDFGPELLAQKCHNFAVTFPEVQEIALKAQLLSGKRGKRGGILMSSISAMEEDLQKLREKKFDDETVQEILVEEKISIAREFFLSITVDRFERKPVLLFSLKGGMDIEDIAKQNPEDVLEILFDTVHEFPQVKMKNMLNDCELLPDEAKEIMEVAEKMFSLFWNEDVTLVEINPLILSRSGKFFAADAKIIIDDNALLQHPKWAQRKLASLTHLEKEAQRFDLSYVELQGDIGVIGNGAGLVMATLDAIAYHGGTPANFCDIGGGASMEMMEKALELVLQKKNLKGIFINIFGGITHCDEIAEGLVDYQEHHNVMIPMVVRMVGTNQDLAKKILEEKGIHVLHSFDDAAKKAAEIFS